MVSKYLFIYLKKRNPLEMCSFFFPSVALELVPLSTACTLIIMVSKGRSGDNMNTLKAHHQDF